MRLFRPSGAVLAALLFWASAVSAQAPDKFPIPDQALVGIEQPIGPGELVDITVSPVKAPPPGWVSSSTVWKVLETGPDGKVAEKRVRAYEGGIFFGAGLTSKRMTVLASINHLYILKDAGGQITEVSTRTNLLVGECVVGSPAPPTPPAPPPLPTPLPDGQFGLAKFAYDQAVALVAGPDRVKGAKAQVTAMRGVASAIAAGALTDVATILKTTKDKNSSALAEVGLSPSAWDSYGLAVQKRLKDLYSAGKLNTPDDFRTVLLELALGLDAIQ